MIRVKNSTGEMIYSMYIFPSGSGWGNNILEGLRFHTGEIITVNLYQSFDFSKQYFIVLIDGNDDNYVKYIRFTQNVLLEFVLEDLYNGPVDGH